MEPHTNVACAVSDSCAVVLVELLLVALAAVDAANGATEITARAAAPRNRRLFWLTSE
jgi:hypothetical protein